MRLAKWTCGAALVGLIAWITPAGCGKAPTPAGTPGISPVAAPPSPSEVANIRLDKVDFDGYKTVLQKHRGQVVLVDIWATWCPSCMEGFPHTVQLYRNYSGKGFTAISLSLDFSPAIWRLRPRTPWPRTGRRRTAKS